MTTLERETRRIIGLAREATVAVVAGSAHERLGVLGVLPKGKVWRQRYGAIDGSVRGVKRMLDLLTRRRLGNARGCGRS